MALTDASSKAIYLEELAAEYGAGSVDAAIAGKAANVIAKTINRILLEELEINPGTFKDSTSTVITGQGETA